MQRNQRLANTYLLLGLGLVCLFAYTLLFCAIAFIRGHSIAAWQFPVAILMMLLTQYYASRELFEIKARAVFLKTSGLLLSVIVVSILFAGAFYDISFDGQWYHQETVSRLKQGWNPYLKELTVPKKAGLPGTIDGWCSGPHIQQTENPNGDQPVLYIKYVSVRFFAKGVEITEAAIYSMTKKIETGKALNLITLLASLFLCLSVLYKMTNWSSGKIWLIALLLAMNPVTIYQLTTFCLDGIMSSMLLSLFASFVLIYLEKNKYAVFLFGLLVMICVNIKFTNIVFAGVFCAGFFIFLLIKKKWDLVKRILISGSISFALGVLFIGFHPYMTNLITYNDPFHGLKETQGIIIEDSPDYLKTGNRFTKFAISYNTYSYETAANQSSLKKILKIPFTVNRTELLDANEPELKVAGFGPFYSGALLVCLILLAIMTIRHYRNPVFKTAIYIFGFLFLSIFVIPDPWWARFVPQFWLFPVFMIILSFYFPLRSRFLQSLLQITLVLNILWAMSGILFNLFITSHIDYQLAQIKSLQETISVEYCGYADLSSNGIRFQENNIPYVEKYVTGQHIYNMVHSTTRFETSEELPEVRKPFLLRLEDKLHHKKGD